MKILTKRIKLILMVNNEYFSQNKKRKNIKTIENDSFVERYRGWNYVRGESCASRKESTTKY